eukprot:8529374-Karenia_brevis.AAC.1
MLKRLNLSELKDPLMDLGATNAGNFAFLSNFVPGSPDDSSFVVEVVVPLLGDPNHKLKPALKRLHFECYHLMAQDAQAK